MIDDICVDRVEVVTVPGFGSCDRTFVAAHAVACTGWYGPIAESYRRAAELLGPTVTGEPVTDHRRVSQLLGSVCDPGDKASSWAAGAIDCAIWDLHGRLASVPVAGLLAASPASAVLAYASWLRLDVVDPATWARSPLRRRIRGVSPSGACTLTIQTRRASVPVA